MNALREQIYEITKKVMYGDRSPRHATDDIMLLIESKLQPLTPEEIETAALNYRDKSDDKYTDEETMQIETHWYDKQEAFIEGADFASTPSAFQKLMDDIMQWSDDTFGDRQRTIPILYHLEKEVPELIGALNIATKKGIQMEFADCFMLLFDAASHHGLKASDIVTICNEKLEINRKRKWREPDENGVIEHIK